MGSGMVPKYVKRAAVCAAFCSLAWPVAAQETGLDALHTQVRVGSKICMLDHFHNGSSNGLSTRKRAEAEAIRVWAEFTAWEYGDNWGSWRLAETKRVNCGQTSGAWACTLEARACKPAGAARKRRR